MGAEGQSQVKPERKRNFRSERKSAFSRKGETGKADPGTFFDVKFRSGARVLEERNSGCKNSEMS